MSYSVRRDNQTFDEVAELDYPCPDDNCLQVDSINGLFCFFDVLKDHRIMLWNPSLRKLLILPKPRVLSGVRGVTVGFGFVASSNEYKIVTFRNDLHANLRLTAAIYELSTGAWRDLKLEDDSALYMYYRQAHLNGILHWYKNGSEQGNPIIIAVICSFDMKNEKFGTLMVPSCLRDHTCFLLSTHGDSLCLMETGRDNLCSIWVMKEYGIADSWGKLFIIDRKQHGLTRSFPRTRHNGELLFGKYYYGSCSNRMELVSYDCKDNQVKNLGVLAHLKHNGLLSAYPYLESLVLMKGLNEVKIREGSTKII